MAPDGKALFVVLGLLAALTIGGFLFLSGAFDSEEPVVAPKSTLSGASEDVKKPRDGAQGSKPVGQKPIETREFVPEKEERASIARASDRSTGLYLRGRVRNDRGDPIRDAEVFLSRDLSTVKARFMEGPALAIAKTNGLGEFSFQDLLPDANFVLRVEHPDFAVVREGPIESKDPAQLDRTITLRPGIGFEGLVVEESGAPIEGATIAVYDAVLQSMDPRGVVERKGESTADGSFVVKNLAAGQKKIVVSKEGYASDGRNLLNLTAIDATKHRFVLKRGLTIRGIALDANGNVPLAGVEIWARPVSRIAANPVLDVPDMDEGEGAKPSFSGAATAGETPGPEQMAANARAAAVRRAAEARSLGDREFLVVQAVSREDGTFELNGVMEANYMLTATRKGFLPLAGRPAKAGDDRVELQLVASARIRGLVIDAETEQPVQNFAISVHPSMDPLFYNPAMRQDFSDGSGRFEYVDAQPGTMYVFAEAPGYAIARSEAIQIARQQTIEGVVLRLERGAELGGFVLDAQSQPVRGAKVVLVPENQQVGAPNPLLEVIQRSMRGNSSKSVQTNAEGRWTLPNVRAGSYRIDVEHSSYVNGRSESFQCGSVGQFEVPAIMLSQGGTVSGIVMKKDGSGPDDGATVMIRLAVGPPSADPSIQTDAQGRFERRGLAPGTYRVQVVQREKVFDLLAVMQNVGQEIVVKEGEVVELTL